MKTVLWYLVFTIMIALTCVVSYFLGYGGTLLAAKIANTIVPGTIFDDSED